MKDLTHFQWSEELLKFLQESKKQKFRYEELPEDLQVLSHLHWAKNRGYIKGERINEGGRSVKLWQPSSSILQRIKI